MNVDEERAAVITEALSWVGTPFMHAERQKGFGVDCAQLLVASFAPVADVVFEPYPPDWFLHSSRERLLEVIQMHCEIASAPFALGDIATFRFGRTVSHAGIVVTSGPLRMVHAYRPTHGVTVHDIGPHTGLASRLESVWRLARWTE